MREFFLHELQILCLGAMEPLCCSQVENEVCSTTGFYLIKGRTFRRIHPVFFKKFKSSEICEED